ncbi:MAG: MFS transporter, partial [Fibrobacter sp.]|nr:MFS transporter [Fibrobacter sp.]
GGAFSYIVSSITTANAGGNLQWSLYLASASSLALGIYSLALPHKIVKKEKNDNIVFRDSLKIILEPRLLFLALFSIIITFADRYYVFGGAIFLKALNFAESKIMLVLGIGQIPEIIGLFFLGFFISRAGMKKVLLFGIIFEIARFTIFTTKTTGIPLITGISLHGLTYAFFFIPVTIFLDSCSDSNTRASVHQLFSIITGGIGNFAGNLLAGFTADIFTNPANSQINFTHFWFVPLLLSIIGLFGISICFSDKKQTMPVYENCKKPEPQAELQ